jgi:hypothetical protein
LVSGDSPRKSSQSESGQNLFYLITSKKHKSKQASKQLHHIEPAKTSIFLKKIDGEAGKGKQRKKLSFKKAKQADKADKEERRKDKGEQREGQGFSKRTADKAKKKKEDPKGEKTKEKPKRKNLPHNNASGLTLSQELNIDPQTPKQPPEGG